MELAIYILFGIVILLILYIFWGIYLYGKQKTETEQWKRMYLELRKEISLKR